MADLRLRGTAPVWFAVRVCGRMHVPDFIEVDADVVVDEDVAHAADRFPIEWRQAASGFLRNAFGCLADHFDVADDGVLQLLRGQKGFSAGFYETGDAAAAFQHVMEIEPVVFHKGVASRRILSRTYQ